MQDRLTPLTNVIPWALRMHSRELAMAMILLVQTTLGSLGNIFLLFHYVSLSFIKYRLRSIDLIFKHLTIANVLVNLSRGIPQTMAAFGWKDFPSDVGCKLLFYVHRVGRGVSLGTTCLLSIFQVIIISPGDARWAELKVKAPKYIGFSLCLCWTLHMLANIMVAMHMTSIWGNDTITQKKDFVYCRAISQNITKHSMFAPLMTCPDVLGLGLMIWASSSMIFILCRHKQRLQHIHRNKVSPGSSPETRATQTILVFVSTFVSSYALSSVFQVCVALLRHPGWWIMNLCVLTSSCFPTVSPFLLLSSKSSVPRLCWACMTQRTTPNLIRNVHNV